MMISGAIRSRTFCLENNLENKPDITAYQLKKQHDYFYQIQCQHKQRLVLFCCGDGERPACRANSPRSRLVENFFHNKIKLFLFCFSVT